MPRVEELTDIVSDSDQVLLYQSQNSFQDYRGRVVLKTLGAIGCTVGGIAAYCNESTRENVNNLLYGFGALVLGGKAIVDFISMKMYQNSYNEIKEDIRKQREVSLD